MAHIKRSKIMLLSLSLLIITVIFTTQIALNAHGQETNNNQWALNFSVLNGQNVASTTFNPFDQIELSSNVTYGNASVPNLLVTFKVQGPIGSANQWNTTTIAETNADGIANSTFRLPAQADNASLVIGTWQATATIRTSNSTLQKSLSFTTQWSLEITSVSIENQQGKDQTIFYPGNTVMVGLNISDKGQPQQANITLNMQDSSDQIVNQTQIENTQIDNGSTSPTQLQTTLEIPANANGGEASITAAIYSGTYQHMGIPAGENQTAYFTVVDSGGATASPSPRPSKTPSILQNSVSLFSWLLVATGLFTFTLLYGFLRRKPTEIGMQMPDMPARNDSPTMAISSVGLQEPPPTNQQPPPAARVASETTIQATTTTQAPAIFETWQSRTAPTTGISDKQETKPRAFQESDSALSIEVHLGRISEIGKKVQHLEFALNVEREQLRKEVTELNSMLEGQEKAVKSYFDSIRQAVSAAMNTQPVESKDPHETQLNEAFNAQNSSHPEVNQKSNAQLNEDNKLDRLAKLNDADENETSEAYDRQNSPQAAVKEKSNTPQIEGKKSEQLRTDERGTIFKEHDNSKLLSPEKPSSAPKKAKDSKQNTERQERTQEEDIRIAEHTGED